MTGVLGEKGWSRLRSRCGRRLSFRSGACKAKFPEPPLVLAGALGGPLCIFLLTPLRNALTLASQDSDSTAWELYASVFRGGFSDGWTGGLAPVLPSCGQFCVMGPLFHFLKEALASVVVAVLLSAMAETLITYGSQTLNAQLAFNKEQHALGGPQVPLANPLLPLGPGLTVHVLRNVVALSGIRIFSGPCQAALHRLCRAVGVELPQGLKQFLADFTASLGAAILSAPLNQCYNFAVTSEAYMAAGPVGRLEELAGFLSRSYLSHDAAGTVTGLSPSLARDLMMRCAYVATLYTSFGAIERAAVVLWRRCFGQDQPVFRRNGTVGVKASS